MTNSQPFAMKNSQPFANLKNSAIIFPFLLPSLQRRWGEIIVIDVPSTQPTRCYGTAQVTEYEAWRKCTKPKGTTHGGQITLIGNDLMLDCGRFHL